MPTRSCECGFSYVDGLESNEQVHSKIHAEYSIGPSISILRNTPRIGSVDEYDAHIVDATVPLAARNEIAHVAMVAQRAMPSYPAGYYGAITRNDERLFVLVNGLHAIAFVLTSLDNRFWHFQWKPDGGARLVNTMAEWRHGAKIGRVWVAANFRRRALAKKLIQLVCSNLVTKLPEIGWELPFTDAGRELVRSLLIEQFWGCGDATAVDETLNFNQEHR